MKRIIALLTVLSAVHTAFAAEQTFPARSIRMIVPFAPGGPNDILGRAVAQKLTEQFGQQVVVDNRGGAGGIIGAETAARATPDGYTLLLGGTASMSINPSLHKKLPYDPLKDFAHISLIGTAPSLVTVNASLPGRNMKELIALAKAKPGQLTFASSGPGTAPHLGGELLKTMAGIEMTHVPYKGGALAYADLMGGQVTMFIGGTSAALPFIKQGKLRGLAVTSLKRTPSMPEMPTVAESGLPGYEVTNWYSIVTSAGTPKPIVNRLNAEIVKALATEELRKRYADLGTDPETSTPEQLHAYTRSEMIKWAKVIKSAGLTPQ